jgi:hypothetical protein
VSGKNRAAARQAVKTARRLQRKSKSGRKSWITGEARAEAQKLISRSGNGGTDKSGSKKKSPTYYSDAPARH